MALLTAQNVDKLGDTVTMNVAAAGGDSILNDGRQILLFANANVGAARTVTIQTAGEVDGVAIDEVAVVVPISGSSMVGPFPPRYFNDSTGRVVWTYSSEADLTVGVFRL